MTASDFFVWAAECARERPVHEARLDSLRDRRGRGIATATTTAGGDPTAGRAMAAMAKEPAVLEALRLCEWVLDRAEGVTRAVSEGLGPMYALALTLHYLDGNTWGMVAQELHVSTSTIFRMRQTALDWIDCEGLTASVGRRRKD